MSTEEAQDQQEPAQGGELRAIGDRLAARRRERKLELDTVASQMHLGRDVVAALEAGDAGVLPAATFVRGYIKSYARLLGLDEQELLAMLPAGKSYEPAPLKAVGMRRPRRRPALPLGKWLVWLLAIAVVMGAIGYGVPVAERLWNKFARSPEGVQKENALPLPPSGTQQEGDQSMKLPPLPGERAQAPADEQAGEEAAVSPESQFEVGEAPAAPETPAQSAAPQPATAPAPGPAMITLHFKEDSWVELESHGRKLVVGTQPAGSERSVRAEPPVQLLLGNAPGVELEYRGKHVDLAPYQRGKVARLVLED